MYRLRGQDYPALEEVKEMLKEEEKSRGGNMRIREVWTDKTVRKPFIIMAVMFILQVGQVRLA